MRGIATGASETETFWTEFLRGLARRGLRGVKLVVSDANQGLKAAIAKVLHATWQRCRVHARHNLLTHAGRQGHFVVAAFICTASAQEDAASVGAQWHQVADQLRPKAAMLAAIMDDMESDVLAYMGFAPPHRPILHSTNPIERPSGEIKRRTDVVGIFPNESAIRRLVGAIPLQQSDEWAVQRGRYMTLKTMAGLRDDPIVKRPVVAARQAPPTAPQNEMMQPILHHSAEHDHFASAKHACGQIQQTAAAMAPEWLIRSQSVTSP